MTAGGIAVGTCPSEGGQEQLTEERRQSWMDLGAARHRLQMKQNRNIPAKGSGVSKKGKAVEDEEGKEEKASEYIADKCRDQGVVLTPQIIKHDEAEVHNNNATRVSVGRYKER